jgi:hypothetical protein
MYCISKSQISQAHYRENHLAKLLAETRRVGDGYLEKQQRIIRKKVKFGGPEVHSTTV